ncbi:1-acyl-sn-glycerol-3-phosphate acyltransferase gamma-like [Hermetia illucens]|nr:1-acyl-sn-glycerol-3-phosphate acyltransferase gamma-like [Hermetia illucens]
MDILTLIKKSKIIVLCVAISYFTSGLIINFFQLLLHLFVKPWSKWLYRRLMYYLCYSFYCQLVFVTDWWSNSKLYVYADEDVMKKYAGHEHVLLLMNHTYEIDWLMGWVLCEKVGVLGNCKAYAKKVIQYFPAVGWAWKFAEFVFLERSYEKDKEIIARQLKEVFDYPDPVWILLNAEGTRFTPEKHEASVKFAKDRGMVPLKYHLIPRTKGFTTSMPTLKGRCDAAYDITLVFKKDDPVKPTVSNLLFGEPVTGYMLVRRTPIDSIPEEEEGAAEWLHNLFREKDKIVDSFHTHGNFFTGSGVKEVPCFLQKRRVYPLINTVAWMIITLTPILYYLSHLLFSGSIFYFSLGIGILAIFFLLLQKSIGMSKISKASSYGAKTTSK